MSIIIETRSRVANVDIWGDWDNLPVDAVTDGTFTDTDLVEYRISSSYNISIEDFSTNVQTDGNYKVTGDGVFDDIMEGVTAHVESQYNLNRISAPDYAGVYLGALQTAIAEAMKFVLQQPTAENNAALTEAQTALAIRQAKGFDDDAKQKLLKQVLDSWSVAYSVAQDANSIPDTIKVNTIDSVMKNAMTNLDIIQGNDPIGEI